LESARIGFRGLRYEEPVNVENSADPVDLMKLSREEFFG